MGLGVKNRSTGRQLQEVCRRSHRTQHLGAAVIAEGRGGRGVEGQGASTGRADPVSTRAALGEHTRSQPNRRERKIGWLLIPPHSSKEASVSVG